MAYKKLFVSEISFRAYYLTIQMAVRTFQVNIITVKNVMIKPFMSKNIRFINLKVAETVINVYHSESMYKTQSDYKTIFTCNLYRLNR